jgi:hypothetical protein
MQHRQKRPGSAETVRFMSISLAALLILATGAGMVGWKHSQQAFAAEDPPGVVVEASPGDIERTYSINEGDCAIKWIVYATENNKGVVKYWARCPLLSQQLPYLSRIFEEFLGKDRNAASLHTLFWGGLVPDTKPASLEMSLRLALAAYRSGGWDIRRGKPVSGDLNRFVKDLANMAPIYPELRALFDRFHRTISIKSVEKVRVLMAAELPFYDELRKAGVQATDRLPFDCMVWFSLEEAR